MRSLTYFPEATIAQTPADAGLQYRELEFETGDREQLYGWWIPTGCSPPAGHILFCHGNGGNVGDRLIDAQLLTGAGFNVLLFDYRGYGRSTGRPDEQGTYRDALAAKEALARQPECDRGGVIYLGESLGGAIALELALRAPPRGLILQSTFTSVGAMARAHYPLIPSGLVPDAYPSIRRVRQLRAPLLVLHGDRDELVPLSQGQELFEAAPQPKRMHVFRGLGHNDLVAAGGEYPRVIHDWVRDVVTESNA
jgi:fermentation-respiration switch protein FrsA (DUF1100 family)